MCGPSYSGPTEEAKPYFVDFDAIESAWDDSRELSYPDIPVARCNNLEAPLCQKYGVDKLVTTTGLQVYNVTTEQEIWNSFKERVDSNPDLAASAFIVHKGYASQAALKHNPDVN